MAVVPWFPGFSSNVTTFPTPYNQPSVIHSGGIRRRRIPTSCFTNPMGSGGVVRNIHIERHERPNYGGSRLWRGGKSVNAMADKSIEATGDFGWTLDYATAWLYRHLTSSIPDVADTIDTLRDCGDDDYLTPDYAYLFFDMLDARLFAGKLKNAVYLRWRSMPSCMPGITSAPKVIPDVPRVCIELNRTPFEEEDAEIDDLLGAMIHQMIHAFLLVCCGAQKRDDTPDGRLMDGVHFGLILMTIREATRYCVDGALDLVFHASKRRNDENDMYGVPQVFPRQPGYPPEDSFISLDPRGHGHASMLHDGQTHCNHDNRHISKQLIKNWQVTEYSKALEADMAAKGEKIWDFVDGNTFEEFDRISAPPSATYIELVYDDLTTADPKRIMANRAKALKFKSLEEPLTEYSKFELLIPECDIQTFRCIYDFINKDGYLATPTDQAVQFPVTHGRGPPVLYHGQQHGMTPLPLPILAATKDESAITHIKVFKAAEKMKFEELMSRALEQLYLIPLTTEDPIALLKQLYNLEPPSTNPIHSELHRWARRFLIRLEEGEEEEEQDQRRPDDEYMTRVNALHAITPHHFHTPLLPPHVRTRSRSSSFRPNMLKIQTWYPHQWRELLQISRPFRDDVELARGQLYYLRRPENLHSHHHPHHHHHLGGRVQLARERQQQLLLEAGHGLAAQGSGTLRRILPLGIGGAGGGGGDISSLLGPGIGFMDSVGLRGGLGDDNAGFLGDEIENILGRREDYSLGDLGFGGMMSSHPAFMSLGGSRSVSPPLPLGGGGGVGGFGWGV